ncbi:hypothetical protein ACFV2U_28865 [Streptomyces sp. NPDC059697]|uniref:hypothetical protein n=1 Tax=Streptomyces sp. NPDC059697 TaxID=3346912 RepID=UPI0036D0C3ED
MDTSSRRPVTGTAPGRKPLPRTAAWRIVKRKGLPTDHDRATDDVPDRCGVRPAEQPPCLDAYQGITADRGVNSAGT